MVVAEISVVWACKGDSQGVCACLLTSSILLCFRRFLIFRTCCFDDIRDVVLLVVAWFHAPLYNIYIYEYACIPSDAECVCARRKSGHGLRGVILFGFVFCSFTFFSCVRHVVVCACWTLTWSVWGFLLVGCFNSSCGEKPTWLVIGWVCLSLLKPGDWRCSCRFLLLQTVGSWQLCRMTVLAIVQLVVVSLYGGSLSWLTCGWSVPNDSPRLTIRK